MVFIRLIGRIVGTEALIILIIVVIGLAPRPAVTLDTEVVITPHGQLTPAGTTLKHTLCQRDRRRDIGTKNFFIFLQFFVQK